MGRAGQLRNVPTVAMNKIPNHTALKEWASVIDALGSGAQIVLIRKGGLADESFGVEAQRFYLFPTNYHDAGGAEPSHVPITHWAEVVKTCQFPVGRWCRRWEDLPSPNSPPSESRNGSRPGRPSATTPRDR